MAPQRPKDKEEQAAQPLPPSSVSLDDFNRTRDRVVDGLSSLQFAIASLLNAYLDHCKGLVGDGPSASNLNINTFGDPLAAPAVDTILADKKGRKKKEKKPRDPNAPKRPLTAAFLYSQVARPIVKRDLESSLLEGEKLGPNQVNEEVNRRWNALPEHEKDAWKTKYRENLEIYKENMKEYEVSKQALGLDVDADAEAEDEDVVAGAAHPDSDAEGSEEEKEPTPSPKVPTPPPAGKGNKRRKVTKENGVTVAPTTEVPLPRASAVPIPAASTPAVADKKKPAARNTKTKTESPAVTKRSAKKGKAADEDASTVEPAAEAAEKKPERKRKR